LWATFSSTFFRPALGGIEDDDADRSAALPRLPTMSVSRSTVSQTVSRQALLFRPKSSVNIDCLVMASLVVDILVLATISLTVISDMFRAVKKAAS
jgi:hypothetical protein